MAQLCHHHYLPVWQPYAPGHRAAQQPHWSGYRRRRRNGHLGRQERRSPYFHLQQLLRQLCVISHANGESTLYAHMSKRLVSEGDKVTQGQTIGLVGTIGSSTGNHLHFEVRPNGQRQDPLNYFRGSTFTLRASGKSVSYTVS